MKRENPIQRSEEKSVPYLDKKLSKQLWKLSSKAALKDKVGCWCGLLCNILYFDHRLPDKYILLFCYFYFQV